MFLKDRARSREYKSAIGRWHPASKSGAGFDLADGVDHQAERLALLRRSNPSLSSASHPRRRLDYRW
jgi:hypothetical protein